ncbi:hypothetical protein SRHO_G00320710 [Serrasalmus rhombeus]
MHFITISLPPLTAGQPQPISSLGVNISKPKNSLYSLAHVLPLQTNSLLLIDEINGQKKLHPTYGKRSPLIITEGVLTDEDEQPLWCSGATNGSDRFADEFCRSRTLFQLTDFFDTWISNGYSDVKRGALTRLK